MKSFCTKLFFKKKIFPKFWSIEHVFRSIEIVIKIFGQPLFVSIDSRLILDQSKHFQSIEPNFRSIENCIESFLKSWFSHVQLTIQKVFKHTQTLSLSLSIRSVKAPINFFVVFLQFFRKVFSSKASKIVLPFLLHLFSSFIHFSCIFWGNFEPINFWGLWWFKLVFFKLINGFLLDDDI